LVIVNLEYIVARPVLEGDTGLEVSSVVAHIITSINELGTEIEDTILDSNTAVGDGLLSLEVHIETLERNLNPRRSGIRGTEIRHSHGTSNRGETGLDDTAGATRVEGSPELRREPTIHGELFSHILESNIIGQSVVEGVELSINSGF
jgi:hypothetical protein